VAQQSPWGAEEMKRVLLDRVPAIWPWLEEGEDCRYVYGRRSIEELLE